MEEWLEENTSGLMDTWGVKYGKEIAQEEEKEEEAEDGEWKKSEKACVYFHNGKNRVWSMFDRDWIRGHDQIR